jgi:hypothetical protein
MHNMKDLEWTLNRLADATILGQAERDALKAACQLIATLRQAHRYPPSCTSLDYVFTLINKDES